MVGTLRWDTCTGALATAETADGRWAFRHTGVLHHRIVVRAEGQDADIAIFETRWSRAGSLRCRNSHSFDWKPLNMWRTYWGWKDSSGRLVAGERGSRVTVYSSHVSSSELSILLLLAHYLTSLHSAEVL
ncbi:MAG: hypothetical protein PVSMB7_08510 [Chloroflexota bacterium]